MFSASYFQARDRFREAVGERLISLPIEARGPGGEQLTLDVAVFGPREARKVVLHTSGLHGIEGFAGSAIQLDLLARGVPDLPEDTSLIVGHVLNPYGMAWLRRVNEENVDLNRNFLAPDEEYSGAPEDYANFDAFLNPPTPPSLDAFWFTGISLILRHGFNALKQTIVGGQYAFPRGLFFGGARLQDGPAAWSHFLAEELEGAEHVVGIDVHTGLGRSGVDTLLVEAAKGSDPYERWRKTFGERVTPWDPEAGVAYAIRGGYPSLIPRLAPQAQVDFVTQEFGTKAPILVLKALREENRHHLHGGGAIDHPTKQALKDTFCRPSPQWEAQILARGKELLDEAFGLVS